MTAFSSPGDEITGSEDIIRLEDVKARISRLESADCHGDLEGTDGCDRVNECPSCYGEAEEELACLRDLLSDFEGGSDASYMVSDSYLEDYAQDEADNLTSGAEYLFPHVNWSDVAANMTMDMMSTTFRGSKYWVAVR